MLKGKGIKSNPREIAVQIVSNVPQNDVVQKVSRRILLLAKLCVVKYQRPVKFLFFTTFCLRLKWLEQVLSTYISAIVLCHHLWKTSLQMEFNLLPSQWKRDALSTSHHQTLPRKCMLGIWGQQLLAKVSVAFWNMWAMMCYGENVVWHSTRLVVLS